ncbi:hypothetical protein F5Y04DRAFT_247651 [Hypomontagnella monticulosa]|nr:hypothetical protein F5Y04DRAFT_247651 [Hypomontagnella monticulosa]
MIPGHRDYDESQESAQVHRDSTQSGGGVLESMMPGHKDHSDPKHGVFGAMKSAVDNTPDVPGALKRATGGGDPGSVGQSMSSGGSGDTGSKSTGGITGRTERNIKFDKLPVPDKYTEPSAE